MRTIAGFSGLPAWFTLAVSCACLADRHTSCLALIACLDCITCDMAHVRSFVWLTFTLPACASYRCTGLLASFLSFGLHSSVCLRQHKRHKQATSHPGTRRPGSPARVGGGLAQTQPTVHTLMCSVIFCTSLHGKCSLIQLFTSVYN